MSNFEIEQVPPAWKANPVPFIATSILVAIIILITIFFVRKELKNEKTK